MTDFVRVIVPRINWLATIHWLLLIATHLNKGCRQPPRIDSGHSGQSVTKNYTKNVVNMDVIVGQRSGFFCESV